MRAEKFIFCTVVTEDYFPFVCALYDSLVEFHTEVKLFVLISDKTNDQTRLALNHERRNISVLYYDSLCRDGRGKRNLEKYHNSHHDAFRWAMKPVLLLHLLAVHEKVAYVDSDIHFYGDYSFLFELLDSHSVLLSPHFRSSDPAIDYDNYIMQFNNGIFNGGFVGVSQKGLAAMTWWANVCNEICEVNLSKGQFVDQSHLNIIPVFFDGVEILRHRGCNVANWNQVECKRTLCNGTVRINHQYPVVFIHFTRSTILGILSGEDALLKPFLDVYLKRLREYGVALEQLIPTPVGKSLIHKMRFSHCRKFLQHRLKWFKAS